MTSNEPARSACDSRIRRAEKIPAAAPTGTLTKKIHSHESVSVRMPPSRRPTAPPPAAIPPQMPSALVRSGPSGNVVVMIARAAGETSAAPKPCSARKPIRASDDQARPLSSEATENTITPAMKMRLRPRMSAARPPSRRKPPNSSV